MSVKNDLNELIRRWLKAEKGIDACNAWLDDYMSAPSFSGCETCGYGSDDYSFDINYEVPGVHGVKYLTIDRSPLSWLADTLLPFEETL